MLVGVKTFRPFRMVNPPKRRKSSFEAASECFWCGLPMGPFGTNDPKAKTREHLIPQSEGGTDIVAAHKACNNARGSARDWTPYRQHMSFGMICVGDQYRRSPVKGNPPHES